MSAASYSPSGPVSFANLMEVRREGEAAIAAAEGPAVFDLSGLANGSSAAVAVLMAWVRAAALQSKSVEFVAAPRGLMDIIELSGLNEVLPVTPDDAAEAVV